MMRHKENPHNRSRNLSARMVFLCSAMLCLSLCLVSCTIGDSFEEGAWVLEESESSTTITMAFAMGDDAHRRGLQTIINDFQKSHLQLQIEVADESPQAKGYAEQLTLLDAMDMFPDLVEMRDTQMFADAGLLAELPEDIESFFEELPEVNGKVYTAPLRSGTPQGIIYNKRLFRDLKLEEPTTYEQFLILCEKLKASGVYPFVVGGQDLWHMGFWINHFLLEYVYSRDEQWNRKRSDDLVSWTDKEPVEAIRSLKELWDRDYVVPGFLTISDSQTINYLISGEAAMLMSGPWVFKQLEEADPSFEVGFFPVPNHDGKFRILGMPDASGWAISAAAASNPEKLKYIKQFLHFFYSEEEYPKYLKEISGMPATKEPLDYEASELVLEVDQLLHDPKVAKLRSMEHYWGEDQIPAGFRNEFYSIIQSVLAGHITVEQAMTQADEAWSR